MMVQTLFDFNKKNPLNHWSLFEILSKNLGVGLRIDEEIKNFILILGKFTNEIWYETIYICKIS